MKSFLIAAPSSGSGKTTVARGLMALLVGKGLKVQPFKCGPDYIDTKFHTAVCGRPSVNLDTFMATPEHVRTLFHQYGNGADVCIVEGMMGLYDGYDRDSGSSAEIARILGLPVVLVVDARSAAYSMAPLLSGFVNYRKDVHICGVIYNKVGSERHGRMLRQVCDDLGLRCFGCVPKDSSIEQGSRYLGLDFSETAETASLIRLLEEHIDISGLLDFGLDSLSRKPSQCLSFLSTRLMVARNAESFSFLYQEALDRFADVRFFDPETEVPQLEDIDLLYLPGGYPEKHAEALAANGAARQAIRDYAEGGGQVVAECGGMMYLCKSIVADAPQSSGVDMVEYPMCGVLPYSISARKADRRLSLGYRRFVLDGQEFRGHEFHYTQFFGDVPPSAVQVYNAVGEPVPTPVFRYKNVLASYTHLYNIVQSAANTEAETRHAQNAKLFTKQSDRAEHKVQALHPLMFVGTGSDVGKSIVATAFCRIFLQDGYHPAPFKAQNMALNSFATPEGLEIGRAQAVQAEAAGIPCHTDMNPLLLKPQSDHTSQVVLNGKPLGNRDAYDYWRDKRSVVRGNQEENTIGERNDGGERLDFRQEVCHAFDRLSARYNPVVMEGAGSISEINLRDTDLVNLPMARHAKADVILVGDIDRGGVFASVYGSLALQTPEDRQLIKGIIINKFRGDMRLFDSGRKMLEDICGIPVLGVIPYYKDIHIEEEDSVALAQKSFGMQQGKVNVAVVMLRHLSNYTDFDALEQDSRIHLFYTNNVSDIQKADIIILPGTKSTLHDLYELRRNGCAQAIVRAARSGATVLGICGGYQMMGVEVCDPDHVEGDISRLPGLGLLPVTTTMSGEKVTRQVTAQMIAQNSKLKELCDTKRESQVQSLKGYEIHMGETRPFGEAQASPLFCLDDGREDGYLVSPHCMGTYLHGILDNGPFVDFLLHPFADKLNATDSTFDYAAYKEQQYNLLADHVRRHVDIKKIYEIMSGNL